MCGSAIRALVSGGVCIDCGEVGNGGTWQVVHLDCAVVGQFGWYLPTDGQSDKQYIYILDTAVDQRLQWSNALQPCMVSPFVLRCAMGFWSPDSVAACPLLRSTLQLLLQSVSTGKVSP